MQKQFARRSGSAASVVAAAMLLVGTGITTARAATWNALVGAQSSDEGKQAMAFLPNELWIRAGDSVRWSFNANEIHTVSFLVPGQKRPPLFDLSGAFIGCPGATPDGSSFDGSSCVTSTPDQVGQTYTVHFPSPGNFKLVCLVHARMTGTVHVLNASGTLPYRQPFYDREAMNQQSDLLSDASSLQGEANSQAQRSSAHGVTAGISAISGNGGGSQMAAVWRFFGETTVVHVGDTVEWTNLAPTAVHTVTFGTEPQNLAPPSGGVTLDADGARHAIISSPTQSVNSGFLIAPNQETVGLPQSPLDTIRFRATFTAPGTYNYICGIHDVVGMIGRVIVLP
jgi:plastocyanin